MIFQRLYTLFITMILFGCAVCGCDEKKSSRKEGVEPPERPAEKDLSGKDSSESNSADPEKISVVPVGVKTVEEVRLRVSDKNNYLVVAVLLNDTRKAIECLQKQHEHGRSCPPPYHTFGDAAPFEEEEERLKKVDARMLVKMDFPPEGLRIGRMYVFHGYWCSDGRLARFCARRIFEVSKTGAEDFLKKRIQTGELETWEKPQREEAEEKKRGPWRREKAEGVTKGGEALLRRMCLGPPARGLCCMS